YALSAVALTRLRTSDAEQPARMRAPVRLEIAEGFRWLWAHPRVRLLTLLTAGFELALSGTVLALIVVLKRHGAHAAGIGLVLALGAVGVTAGYVVAPWIQRNVRLRTIVVSTLWLLVCLWCLYAVSSTALLIGPIMAAAGATASVYLV